jgi:hypothetical protein
MYAALLLTTGYVYFFTLYFHFNHSIYGKPIISIAAQSILSLAIACGYYVYSIFEIVGWKQLKGRLPGLWLFKTFVAPYLILFWIVKFDARIVMHSGISGLLAFFLFIMLNISWWYYVPKACKWDRLVSEQKKIFLTYPPTSRLDMVVMDGAFLILILIILRAPTTSLYYLPEMFPGGKSYLP